MIAVKNNKTAVEFEVIHPMFDAPEEKRTGEGLGLMKLSPGVRFCLMLLRVYLIGMSGLLGYHLLDLAGFFGHRLH